MADVENARSAREAQRREFQIMGTFAELQLRCDREVAERAFDDAVHELESLSATLTRFDPNSPIELLNDAGGGQVSELLREVLVASLRAFNDTGGLVNVGVGQQLIDAGYDRDFDQLEVPSDAELAAHQAAMQSDMAGTADALAAPFELELDGTVRIKPGVRLDLGGIAKGWAADRIVTLLASHGSCLVNLGGDVAVHVAPGDEPWPIGIELPSGWGVYALTQGGLATSGQDRRAWRVTGDDTVAHHIIDPRTGRSAATDVLRISVFGASCLDAEIWAKALFLSGCDGAADLADQLAIPAILVGVDGAVRYCGVPEPVTM